ncbi:MAG: di-heme oxidoredictase family protein [Planctomycetaceae bacterium]
MCKLMIQRVLSAATLVLIASQSASWAGSASSLMDISANGRWLACSNRDNGSVTIVDLESLSVAREIAVGHHPEGVTFLGDGTQFAVAVYGDDVVRIIDADSGTVVRDVPVFDEPYGLIATRDGKSLFVTLEYPGELLRVDTATGEVAAKGAVGQFPRGLAMTSDQRRLLVTEYFTGIVREVDAETCATTGREWAGSAEDNLARQIVVHPTRGKAYIPHQRSVVTNPHGTGAIFPYVSVIDTDADATSRRKRVQMDSFRGTYVVANPWEADISPDGSKLYVVFGGTNDLFVCNVLDDNYRELTYRDVVQVGSNPRAVRVAADGRRFYVYNALDFEVVAYDAESLRPIKAVKVCESPLDDELLLGKKLFYLAKEPMVGLRWISCSSCHPDGDADGRTWQQPEGLRNTQSLAGMAWTHPIHWSADRDEVQDFEHTIRSALMRGRGLVSGSLNDSLGEANSGLSPQLDALAAYANSHDVPLSPHAKSGLTPAAERGRELFFSEQVGCAQCHSGAYLCDSRPGPVAGFALHDVGTGNDDPSELMGPKYDTPTLLGVYRTAPYLHHGKAKTLEEVLTTFNPADRHGRTSHLSDNDITALVEYLKALPYEDPTPAAKAEGLEQIRK